MNEKKIISCPECNQKIRVPKNKHIKFTCVNCKTELEFNDTNGSEEKKYDSFFNIFTKILSYLAAIPLFLLLHKIIPDFNWKFHLDRVLLFIFLIAIIKLVVNLLKEVLAIGLICLILYLSYGSIAGKYGFKNIFEDYKYMLFSIANNPNPINIFTNNLKPFHNKSNILDAIDYNNPEVRNYAVSISKKYFLNEQKENQDYRKIIQCFAIFKEVENNWNYVEDPEGHEYFAKANETMKHLSGDCDDYSIFMASCIKAIGGTARLVRTTGHLYPELLIGDKKDLEKVNYLIKKELFAKESDGKDLFYHIDENENVWLNLDYTEKYPGGKFMSKEVLGTLLIDN